MPKCSIKLASLSLLLGILLTPLISIAIVAAFEMSGTRHSFGLIRHDGRFWSVEILGVTGVTEVWAYPFDNEAQAQAHVDRQLRQMAVVGKMQGQPTFTIDQPFVPPSWESASACTTVPSNADPAIKGLNYAQNRAFGFPMRYGAWTRTDYYTADGRHTGTLSHAFARGPIPIPTRLIWPGAAIDVLLWSLAAYGCMTLIRLAWRRLRRKPPEPASPSTTPPPSPAPSHP